MAENDGEGDKVNTDFVSRIGDDAMDLFRVNMVILGLFISVVSLIYQGGDTELIRNTLNSFYFINGVIFWLGSVVGTVFTYRSARKVETWTHYKNLARVDDETVLKNYASACITGTMIATLSFFSSLLDGVNPEVTIPPQQLLIIILFSVMFLGSIWTFYVILDAFRGYFGPIRELLP
jgi:hypothetical protein